MAEKIKPALTEAQIAEKAREKRSIKRDGILSVIFLTIAIIAYVVSR